MSPGVPFRESIERRDQWLERARRLVEGGHSLLALWGSDHRAQGHGFTLRAVFKGDRELVVLTLPDHGDPEPLPSLAPLMVAADRLERATEDLLGLRIGEAGRRPWIRHGRWPVGSYPLRAECDTQSPWVVAEEAYGFVSVGGEGVHELGVGPVHAAVIEPGHFHFSVVGEKVLRLEARLGYAHRGIERAFAGRTAAEGAALAARVSGDSTVAFSWAYCMALEGLCGAEVPARGLALRALALERERMVNHLGDLGALAGDAGLVMAASHFARLKERCLRVHEQVFGSRYLFDFVTPGGVALDRLEGGMAMLQSDLLRLAPELAALRALCEEHAGLQDRWRKTGVVTSGEARALGLVGFAARSSGVGRDLRVDMGVPPYDQLAVVIQRAADGDVAARATLRFDEIDESIRLCHMLLRALPEGASRAPMPPPGECESLGLGAVEGFRGPVLVALELGPDGRLTRVHPHDPSAQNWAAVEHAMAGGVIADFPLINKSFNLAYSGVDL